ncbi:type II toxin-antitoxin system HicA family toxin [Bacillus carboniphilus]|uniref:Type II toxin-antitoxin system HicA family toxin n=1 Tax=Bacillus carboniphilus TaxID=86663 RepID=A0ABY9JT49_9BACI|nr:type II toxin-antitoxin system HicA family toxin [Bacillus carboniphilus]WLR42562.1 type II toxin-antitoxin system HicA family toxin [Bacillus carboniphilus]
MPNIEKIIGKMKNQPRGVRYNEAKRVLNHYGYTLIRKRGSNRYFRNKEGDLIVVKKESVLKISYVNDILERINEE